MQKLPAAALTTFVATLQAPWFPLPPGPENQGENCERLIFFFDEAVAKTFWPRSADSAAETSCSCLDSLRGNVAGAVVSVASRSRKSGGKLRTPNFFFLTRPSTILSGPDQPTSTQKLPAAALTTFVATLQAPWFPLPPGPENQGENCERLIFFFDEAVAKTFWPGSADSAAETSCSCLDGLYSNVKRYQRLRTTIV